MGLATANLNLSKSAYIRYDNPGTHYGTAAGATYGLSGHNYLLFGFPGLASNLKRKRLLGFKLTTRLRFGQMPFSYYPLVSDFDAQTVTYYSRPTFGSLYASADSTLEQKGNWYDFTYPTTFPENKGQATQNTIRHGLAISSEYGPYSDDIDNWYGQITLSNSSPAYLTVAYDPDVTVTSKIQATVGPNGNTVSSLSAQLFSWQYVKNSSYYCYDETWTQSSAKFFWKTSEEGSYHQVSISGASLSYTAPAETFPAGKTINWYIQGTDTDGTTTATQVWSFNTYAANLVLVNYPSGSNIYTGQALSFSWDVTESAGSHTQTSAIFYWKKQTAGSWNQISISGNTKRYTAPANTFPTGSTVQWYVTVTDKSGTVRTSSTMSFSTGSATIRMISYPSGNSVNYGGALSFTWDFTSASGTYAQQSATLYWRASTSDPWSSIAASGSTKSLSVAAYIFPANSTITWYMSGTDSGGTSSQTNQMSFKTAAPVITPQNSPTSGYADPRNPITFSWYFTDGSNSYDQQSASLNWRVTGASTWNTVAASGTTRSVTVAANTFPTLSSIEWKLTGAVRGGYSSESSVYTFSTTASTAYAVCQDPVGKAVDGSKAIILRWAVQNSDGSSPSRTIVKWKKTTETASSWRTVLDTTSTVYTHTVAAGTFPAGGIDWQVVAYNRDSAAGPASLASFVCIMAPDAPQGLTATAVPRTTISWQSSGQQAYEIEIDGIIYASAYGPAITSWRKDFPLPDGEHQIRVRIQGEYGLWSAWSATTISVQNNPPITMTLTGKFRVDAHLSLTLSQSITPVAIHWYRDGKRIAQTIGPLNYLDRFVLGEHEYYAEAWFNTGNYSRSNIIRGTMRTDQLLISPTSGGEWLSLKYSEKSDRSISYSRSLKSEMIFVTASPFPVLETSPYETLIGEYSCAFHDQESVRALEQMYGQTVILKSRDGSVIIGGLTQLKKTASTFYTTLSFSVQQTHWEDFVLYEEND